MAMQPILRSSTQRCSTTCANRDAPHTPSVHVPPQALHRALRQFNAQHAAEWPLHVQHLTTWFNASHPVLAPYKRTHAPPRRAALLAAALWHTLHTQLSTCAQGEAALDAVDVYFDARGGKCVAAHQAAVHANDARVLPLRLGDVLYSAQSMLVPHMVHPCVYVGGGRVVHVTTQHTSIVHIERHTRDAPVWAPITHAPVDVFGTPTPAQRRQRVFRALACIGTWPYHPLWNTCEHFVRAVCGVPRGLRVQSLQSAAPLYAIVVVALWAVIMMVVVHVWAYAASRRRGGRRAHAAATLGAPA